MGGAKNSRTLGRKLASTFPPRESQTPLDPLLPPQTFAGILQRDTALTAQAFGWLHERPAVELEILTDFPEVHRADIIVLLGALRVMTTGPSKTHHLEDVKGLVKALKRSASEIRQARQHPLLGWLFAEQIKTQAESQERLAADYSRLAWVASDRALVKLLRDLLWLKVEAALDHPQKSSTVDKAVGELLTIAADVRGLDREGIKKRRERAAAKERQGWLTALQRQVGAPILGEEEREGLERELAVKLLKTKRPPRKPRKRRTSR